MLQIISGKFYKSETDTDKCKGVLFCSRGCIEKIIADNIEIEPVSRDNYITTYVVSYNHKMIKSNQMRQIGTSEIIRQIKLICSFSMDAFFNEDKNTVFNICREKKLNSGIWSPSAYLSTPILEKKLLSAEEIVSFQRFFKKMIGLKRNVYLAVISCLSAYYNSIVLLDNDINQAYSLLVYCLESLSQQFDDYTPTWNDFPQNQRVQLESVFKDMEETSVLKIKDVLVKNQSLKSTMRFVDFVLENSTHNEDRDKILTALKNAYSLRSKYAHELKPLLYELSFAPHSKRNDIIYLDEKNTYFTYSGLIKTAKSVIGYFVHRQETVDYEDYDWSSELPQIKGFLSKSQS